MPGRRACGRLPGYSSRDLRSQSPPPRRDGLCERQRRRLRWLCRLQPPEESAAAQEQNRAAHHRLRLILCCFRRAATWQPLRRWTWRVARGGTLGELWMTSYSSVFFRKSLQGVSGTGYLWPATQAETRRRLSLPPDQSHGLLARPNQAACKTLLSRHGEHHRHKTITKVMPRLGDELNNGVVLPDGTLQERWK